MADGLIDGFKKLFVYKYYIPFIQIIKFIFGFNSNKK